MAPRVVAYKWTHSNRWHEKRENEAGLLLFQHGENVYRERADKNIFSNV